jgi:hypothetical protein
MPSATQYIPFILCTCPYPEADRSSPNPHLTSPRSILITSIYAWVLQVASFPQIASLKPCMHLYPTPYVLHALPIKHPTRIKNSFPSMQMADCLNWLRTISSRGLLTSRKTGMVSDIHRFPARYIVWPKKQVSTRHKIQHSRTINSSPVDYTEMACC